MEKLVLQPQQQLPGAEGHQVSISTTVWFYTLTAEAAKISSYTIKDTVKKWKARKSLFHLQQFWKLRKQRTQRSAGEDSADGSTLSKWDKLYLWHHTHSRTQMSGLACCWGVTLSAGICLLYFFLSFFFLSDLKQRQMINSRAKSSLAGWIMAVRACTRSPNSDHLCILKLMCTPPFVLAEVQFY